MKVLEELCNDDTCPASASTHWHPFTGESILKNKPGEYTVTLRVRSVKKRKTMRSSRWK